MPPSDAEQPLVTIAMPARNSERTIALALRSIMAQTYPRWELLLMDDGSTDRTLEIASALGDDRIRILRDGRWLGLAARLNQAIDATGGPYLARLDADDVAFPERLARQVDFLQHHPAVDLLGSSAVVFDDAGRAVGRFPAPETHADICRRPWSGFHLPHPSWMGRTEWFRKHRYRSEHNRQAQDQDLLLRSYQVSTFANLPEALIGYRQSELSPRKFARGRWQWVRVAVPEAARRHAYGAVISVPILQFAKASFETLAIATGKGRQILRHRAMPLTPSEVQRWTQLWQHLNTIRDRQPI